MDIDFTEATASVQAMVNGFIERLPYLAVALIVFVNTGAESAVHAIFRR